MIQQQKATVSIEAMRLAPADKLKLLGSKGGPGRRELGCPINWDSALRPRLDPFGTLLFLFSFGLLFSLLFWRFFRQTGLD